jgi:nicotinamide-nucleotide amidase
MADLPVCDILNTGTELTLGRTLNRHGAWLGRRLFESGLRVRRQLTLPDGEIIRDELAQALAGADLVLVTGGLGPTHDDMSRDYAAALLGLPMALDPGSAARIECRLAARGRTINDGQRRQAMVPAGASVLANDHGTAPGLWFGPDLLPASRARGLALLPGPPRELHPMFINQVEPLLRGLFPGRGGARAVAEFHFAGIGEGDLAARLDPLLAPVPGLEVGYCAHASGTMELRLIGTEETVARAAALVRPVLPAELFSESSPRLEQAVVERLRARGETLALAESCTGGALASRVTDVPGSSAVFTHGFVTYANAAKETLLGVSPALLAACGAVSAEVALAMAEGALAASGADHALAVTGIAGPDGGSPEKPVGTVWIARAGRGRPASAACQRFICDRETFKQYVATSALATLLRYLAAPPAGGGR